MRNKKLKIGNCPPPKKGFALMEILVGIAVLTLLSVAVAEMTVALLRFTARESAYAETERRAAAGIEPMRETASAAKAVLANAIIQGTSYVSGDDEVAFTLQSIDQNGALLSGTDTVGFRRDGTNPSLLVQETDAAAGSARTSGKQTIASFVDVFRVRYNTSTPAHADRVEIYLETGRDVRGGHIRYPLMTAERLENKE